MYKFNEELCRQLSNGDIACKYDNGNLDMLRALMKMCAPEDTRTLCGDSDFYWVNRKDFWCSAFETTKPTVPLSDFIVNESEYISETSKWSDETKQEFYDFCMNKKGTGYYLDGAIQEFVASKQRKPLFTTEDGKQIFKGDVYWYVEVDNNFDITSTVACSSERQIPECKYFSTESAAREYVRLNKSMYSLSDVRQGLVNINAYPYEYRLITELEKLKQ